MVLSPLCAQGAHSAHAPPPFLTIEVIFCGCLLHPCVWVLGCSYRCKTHINTAKSLRDYVPMSPSTWRGLSCNSMGFHECKTKPSVC